MAASDDASTAEHEDQSDGAARTDCRILARALGLSVIARQQRVGGIGEAVEMQRPGHHGDHGQ